MSSDMSDNESVFMDQDPLQDQDSTKTKKKPGRKPNPASPALRKAQNRAAQRAFRERKEKHMKELEVSIKQIREQRDRYHAENEQLKADHEIIRSENWYLKGIVLTLQLVCFQHNIEVPQHGPYMNEQELAALAQSMPDSISTYINVNANNKPPIPSKLFDFKHSTKHRDRYLSTGTIVITKDGIHNVPDKSSVPSQPAYLSKSVCVPRQTNANTSINNSEIPTNDTIEIQDDEVANIPPLSPKRDLEPARKRTTDKETVPIVSSPTLQSEEPLTSNLAAIQTLRLRLRLQSACVSLDSTPFAIQPTLLQLTIPHDPRIDLVPTPHMRDRMILFRDLFNLDDCFRCLLGHSVFHGGDPAIASNWELPPDFFKKYWYLTIDYGVNEAASQWKKTQDVSKEPSVTLLSADFMKMSQQVDNAMAAVSAAATAAASKKLDSGNDSSSDSDTPSRGSSPNMLDDETMASFEPVRLTNGISFSYPTRKASVSLSGSKVQRHHPYQTTERQRQSGSPKVPPVIVTSADDAWETLLNETTTPSHQNYNDFIMDTMADS